MKKLVSFFTVCFITCSFFLCKAEGISLPGTPLAYKEVNIELNKHATPGRDQLTVTLVLGSEQEKATQKELISTAMQAALDYHKMVGSPITIINMLAQNTGNAWADKQLAFIVYIPDKKGYDGKQEIGIWDKAIACERGFTADELTYLQLWGKLRTKYLDPAGDLPMEKEDALEADIIKTMGKKLSTDPMFNVMWAVDIKN